MAAHMPQASVDVLVVGGGPAGLYAAGMSRMRGRSGVSPRSDAGHLLFAGGWVALAIALVSPLHPLGSALFSAHMVQHEILMMVAARNTSIDCGGCVPACPPGPGRSPFDIAEMVR